MNFETFKELTRLDQSLIGLPFVLSGVLLAFLAHPFSFAALIWIIPAFLMARVSGMAFNQLIDRNFDEKNPRTKNRAIPSGRASPAQARLIALGSLALFLVICWKINFLCFVLSPLIAFLIVIYSYLKRVHASCHFVLGVILFFGPVMAYIAMSGTCSWSVIFLGLGLTMSIAANDIVYAIQDYQFDKENRLHSIPSRWGIEKGLQLSKILNGFCLLFLTLAGYFAHLPFLYYGSILIICWVLYHFHGTVSEQFKKTKNVTGVESVFFFCNVAVSFSTFLFILFSVLWVVLL